MYADAVALGLRVFMDEREVDPGEEFSEVIRQALVGSREMALLATANSLKSEWVTTEWGSRVGASTKDHANLVSLQHGFPS